MNTYTIRSITIKNFKIFGPDGYAISFENDKLIVFDGPNGYGKTSIFDAIELALTGNISRFIDVETNSSPKDIVVAHNDSKDVEIKLELAGSPSLTIVRRLKKNHPKGSTKTSKLREVWDCYRCDNNEETLISEENLRKLLSLTIERDYHLFHYIQQEDTAHFLKSKNEKVRAEAITELFGDTKKEESKYKQLEEVNKRIVDLRRRLEAEKGTISKTFGLSEVKVQRDQFTDTSFQFLLPWLQKRPNAPEWDKEVIHNLNSLKRDQILGDLSRIHSLVENRNCFLSERKYLIVTKEVQVIRSLIVCSKYLQKIDGLIAQAKSKGLLEKALPKLTRENVSEFEKTMDLESIFVIVAFEKGNDFLTALRNLKSAVSQNKGSNQLYAELIQYRDETFKKFTAIGDTRKSECPMCGTEFETTENLLKSISQKGDYYKSLLDNDGKRILNMKSSFENLFLKPLVDQIKNYLDKTMAPEPKLREELEKALTQKERIENCKKWLDDEQIEYSAICFDYRPSLDTENEINRRIQTLITQIMAKPPLLTNEYFQTKEGKGFESVYQSFFENKAANLQSLEEHDIESKIGYVQSCYYNSIEEQVKKVASIQDKIKKLDEKQEIIRSIKETVMKEIRIYQKKLITDIEIPFYLYSGKILQTHQSGTGYGVFIKDPVAGDELKNIRFVADWKSEHDIINTMSSAQIAAVVISLTLALNRIYSKKFDTILIDDPIQTMDDINMISFVELLRNEFPDKQFIISTHEEDVSRYLLYKFLKHGHSVRKVNLMERKEYQLKA